MDEDVRQRKDQLSKNMGVFVDAEMLAILEPSLHKHFIGPPKISGSSPKNGVNLELNTEKRNLPPPLPQVSSSSDVYTKKIANFKKKLKTFKGISNLTQDSSTGNKIVIRAPKNSQKPNVTTNSISNIPSNLNSFKNGETKNVKSTKSQSKPDFSNYRVETKLFYTNIRNGKDNKINDEGMISINGNFSFNNEVMTKNYESNYEPPFRARNNSSDQKHFNSNNLETSSPTFSIFNPNSSDLNLPIRKFARESRCSICDIKLDTLYNVQDSERIVELKCGHMIHEECLIMELELNLSLEQVTLNDKSMLVDYLPMCVLCSSHLERKTIPKDNKLLTQIFTRLITSTSKNCANSMLLNNTTLTIPTPLTPKFMDSFKFEETEFSSSSVYSSLPQTRIERLGKEENIDTRNVLGSLYYDDKNNYTETDSRVENDIELVKELKPLKSSFYKKHSKKSLRGSFVSGTSAIISSVINEISSNEANETWNESFPNNIIKQEFIDDLISLSTKRIIEDYDDSNFRLTKEFIKSLGKFRIVDKINILDSYLKSELNITENYCYLFSHILLTFNLIDCKFKLVSINLSTFIDTSEHGCITLKASKNAKGFYKLIFNSKELELKWRCALKNLQQHIDNDLVTSTLRANEFDDIIENELNDLHADIETIGTLQSYIGEDGYRRLPTGVCPRFYEGTINSLIFKEKPTNAIIVLNQTNYIPSSVTAIKNIIRSLSMIGITIKLVLCSTSTLSTESNILDSYELNRHETEKSGDVFMSKIDAYQEKLQNKDSNIIKGITVIDIINAYIKSCSNRSKLTTMIISNSSLKNINDIPTPTRLLIEVGLDARKKSNREDVADLASWDDIMEVICVYCGLEFDESDFYLSSDDDDDYNNTDNSISDLGHLSKRNSKTELAHQS